MGTNASPNTAEPGALSPEELVLQRRLKILVAGLGLLIVLGLLLVIGRVVYLASRGPSAAAPAASQGPAAGLAATGEITMALPPGAQVKTMTLDGGRLAVQFDAPSGAGIAVLDLDSGRTLSRVRFVPEPPRN